VTRDWARKAADLYHPGYARMYREHDERIVGDDAVYLAFCGWLRGVADAFGRPIDVLDLGCGTGRYFRALGRVRSLVGIDASSAMLAEAAHPVGAGEIGAASIELIEGDFLAHAFASEQFDLVYSVGVLAEHSPLDAGLITRIGRWLKPGGRFAFTTVHPDSLSIPRTIGRTAGRLAMPFAAGMVRRYLHRRLTADGMYADEALVCERLASGWTIESLTRFESEAHLHCLCVARRVTA
jgi:SAM-dependent methyltransferase